MATTATMNYSPVQLDAILKDADQTHSLRFTSSTVAPLGDELALKPVQTKGRWSFAPIALRTAAQWWLETSSSQGLAAGLHSVGKLKTASSSHDYWTTVDASFEDDAAQKLGFNPLVVDSLNSCSIPLKELKSGGGSLDSKSIPADTEFSYVLDYSETVAESFKAVELNFVNDVWTAYDLLCGALVAMVRDVPHQASEAALWQELWNQVSRHPVCRGVVPNDARLFNVAQAWTDQLSQFFQDICSLALGARHPDLNDSTTVGKYVVAWATEQAWKTDAPETSEPTEAVHPFNVPANTIVVRIAEPVPPGPLSSRVINKATIAALRRARRQLQPLDKLEDEAVSSAAARDTGKNDTVVGAAVSGITAPVTPVVADSIISVADSSTSAVLEPVANAVAVES